LMRDLRITEEEAYLMLQKQSRQRRLSMREVAEAIILSEEVRRAQSKGASA
jgi:uroporphyrinogen-III synthase